jgi:hypothetical protein
MSRVRHVLHAVFGLSDRTVELLGVVLLVAMIAWGSGYFW